MADENKIADALRAGRITRIGAWWARLTCVHNKGPSYPVERTNGIDTWTETRHKCIRCGREVRPRSDYEY